MNNLIPTETENPLKQVEQFQSMVNRKLDQSEISLNNQTKTDYLAISHVQMKLDELYFGLWQTHSYTTHVVANELVGQIVLEVFHPKAQTWIKRTGTSAVTIRMAKGSKITDMNAKIKNALVADAPHLMAECIKSAAKTLGVQFGRDLNRAIVDTYSPIIQNKEKSLERQSQKTMNFIQNIATTREELETVKNSLTTEEQKEAYLKKETQLFEKELSPKEEELLNIQY